MRPFRVFAASLTALASVGILCAPAIADPDGPPPGYSLVGTLDPASLPPAPAPARDSGEIQGTPAKCTQTPADSNERKSGIYKICNEVSPGIPDDISTSLKNQALKSLSRIDRTIKPATTADTPPDDPPEPSTACSATKVGTYAVDRWGYCMKGLTLTGTTWDAEGEIVGTTIFNVDSSYALAFNSTTWDEQFAVTMTATDNPELAAQYVQIAGACGSSCTASGGWTSPQLVGLDQTVTSDLSFSSPVTAGSGSSFTPSYSFSSSPVLGAPLTPATWKEQNQVRCDAEVGSGSGCVHPDFAANLVFSLAQFGAAAATYDWAQTYLPTRWGLRGAPLHRLASEDAANANRASTCEDGSFVYLPDSNVPDDSCDEFPFARTEEGGTPGGLCANIVPLLEDGTWEFFQDPDAKPVTKKEPCVRGHVPQPVNSAAGGKLGSFPQTERVLDGDAYTMSFTDVP